MRSHRFVFLPVLNFPWCGQAASSRRNHSELPSPSLQWTSRASRGSLWPSAHVFNPPPLESFIVLKDQLVQKRGRGKILDNALFSLLFVVFIDFSTSLFQLQALFPFEQVFPELSSQLRYIYGSKTQFFFFPCLNRYFKTPVLKLWYNEWKTQTQLTVKTVGFSDPLSFPRVLGSRFSCL